MRLTAIKQALSDIVELTTEDGPVFFIRTAYLKTISPEQIQVDTEFDDEKANEIFQAGLSFACERKAEEYLARCEQSRSGLEKKLFNKKFDKISIQEALDYLESRNLLSDKRFCLAWLQSHIISKPQGYTRLLAELLSRGIKTPVAKNALLEFFADENEENLCHRAYKKALANGKKDEKLLKYMMDSGFSYKMIKRTAEEIS